MPNMRCLSRLERLSDLSFCYLTGLRIRSSVFLKSKGVSTLRAYFCWDREWRCDENVGLGRFWQYEFDRHSIFFLPSDPLLL